MENNSSNIDSQRAARYGSAIYINMAIIFVALKLSGQIDWDWLWVLSPLWLPAFCVLTFVIFILSIYFSIEAISNLYKRTKH